MKTRDFITITLREHINGFSIVGTNGLETFLDEVSEDKVILLDAIRRWALLEAMKEKELTQ